jgi:hypothetical protein
MRERAPPTGYDTDFARWAESQAALLREGRFDELDVPNLAKEVDALARRDHRELLSRLTVIGHHLLKLTYQPERAPGSWRGSIVEQGAGIRRLLKESPSLAPLVEEYAKDAYSDARRQAAAETGLPIETFPQDLEPELERAAARAIAGEDFEL